MKIRLTQEQSAHMKAFLDAFEDAEALTAREYVADFYEADPPFSVDLVFSRDAVFVDGAAVLKYDEEQDGWYIAERIEDADTVRDLLTKAGALKA